MDEMVLKAMAKWPQVPHCVGWLGLDARGHWWLRDAAAQAAGAFTSGAPGAKGSRLEHRGLMDFIGRNYSHDASGCWYFQNGPQRVYVELEATPWIWRVSDAGQVHTHTGLCSALQQVFCDERGWVYLLTERGFGLLHSQDVATVANLMEQHVCWQASSVSSAELATRFGYQTSPAQTLQTALG